MHVMELKKRIGSVVLAVSLLLSSPALMSVGAADASTNDSTGTSSTVTPTPAVCTDHTWGEYKVVQEPTVFAPGYKERSCTNASVVCNEKQREEIPKLTPTCKLNYTSITLQKKKTKVQLTVSGLANGDYVKKFYSSKKKIATVDGKGKIKGVKNGTAYIYVKLASGLTKKCKVKVQSGKVKTTSVKVNTTSLTLRKGKTYQLTASRSPAYSGYGITYSSSKKSVATVSKSGLITAKKKGTAKIYVKSGSKKKTVSVTVLDGVNNPNQFIVRTSTIRVPNQTDGLIEYANKISTTILADANWQYSNSGLSIYFEAARNKTPRVTSCANFVCFCLQKSGILREGMRFYSDGNGKLKYEGNSYYSANKIKAQLDRYCTIIDIKDQKGIQNIVDTAGNPVTLQPGDICCWKGHTNIFEKYSNEKTGYWFDAGRGSVSDNKAMSGTFTNMHRASTFSGSTLTQIIRLKPEFYNYDTEQDNDWLDTQ